MKRLFQNARGTVMMEFLIVFPIYLVLWAGIMAVGDMLVHMLRLPAAERTAAFDLGASVAGAGWNHVVNTLFHPQQEIADDGDVQDQLAKERELDYSADEAIAGPWSMLAGETVRNRYKLLAGGTAGQLAFGEWHFADVTGEPAADDDFHGLIWNQRRMTMHSKDVGTATYNYYTLKRRRDLGPTWRDHGRGASNLLTQQGNRRGWQWVSGEAWVNGVNQTSNRGQLKTNPPTGTLGDYRRFAQFVSWSD